MAALAALLLAATLGVTGGTVPTLIADLGPLRSVGTIDGCQVWEGHVTVQTNVPWHLAIGVDEPCGQRGTETSGAPSGGVTHSFRVGSLAAEPVLVVALEAAE